MNSRLDRHRRSQTQNATPVLVRKHREYSCYWCTSVSCVPFCLGRSADLRAARRGREAHGWGRGYGFFAVCVQSAVCAERKRPTGARKNEEKEEQKEARQRRFPCHRLHPMPWSPHSLPSLSLASFEATTTRLNGWKGEKVEKNDRTG